MSTRRCRHTRRKPAGSDLFTGRTYVALVAGTGLGKHAGKVWHEGYNNLVITWTGFRLKTCTFVYRVILVFFLSLFVFILAVFRETIRGSYETKGCVGNVARCCMSQCHRHVFGSHNVHMRNKKVRRHSRRIKKETRHLFSKFFKAMDRGIGEVKAQSVEEDHDKSLKILQEHVVVKSRNSHRRLEQRLAIARG